MHSPPVQVNNDRRSIGAAFRGVALHGVLQRDDGARRRPREQVI
jgi:hypothetical protein